ncbi:MAG TPA: FtsX-like permease family protein [Ornithinicoccus sp.]|nr:FtsX-like permease family protein [Ornithinicoccus sp.]
MSRSQEAFALGWRLALRTSGHARLRAAALVGAAALGTVLTLAVLMIGRAVRRAPAGLIADDGAGPWWLAGAVLAILLPVVVLVATVARLSAALREQRNSRLRLLGLTPGQARLVNLGESGVLALAGWLAGLLLAWLGRPLLAVSGIGGRRYEVTDLGPSWLEVLVSLLVVPVLVAGIATSTRTRERRVLTTARGAGGTRPGWWRLVPLLAGVGMLIIARRSPRPTDLQPGMRNELVLGGIALLALGIILVLPVAVRYLAAGLIRGGGPVSTVAGRRLQAQPGAQTRVLSALLVALFLATAAQGVVVTLQDVPQYAIPRQHATVEASTTLHVPAGSTAEDIATRARAVPGVRSAVVTHVVAASCDSGSPMCDYLQVNVASCEAVQQLAPGTTGCRDDRAAWIGQPYDMPGQSDALTLGLHREDAEGFPAGPPLVQVSLDRADVVQLPIDASDRLNGPILVPVGLPGVQEALAASGFAEVHVTSDPRRDLVEAMRAADLQVSSFWDLGEMDRIQRTIDTVRLVGALVLVLGLTSCAVGALDRAIERRREVVRLQLLGIPARTLTLSHWLEVAVPILLGTGLALGLGWLAGDSYLLLISDDERLRIAPSFIWPMIAAAGVGSVLVAWATSLAANTRIRPELIRAA